ncbi:MAG: site-specific integrase [Anaerolineales bacterium]|nr:site-specific integrase [Anaerolineales bacterium]
MAEVAPLSAGSCETAKALINSGVSLDKVATLLGNNSLNMMRIYTTLGGYSFEDVILCLN